MTMDEALFKKLFRPGSRPTRGPYVVTRNERERTVQIDHVDDSGRAIGTIVQPGAITWLPNAPLLAASWEMAELLRVVADWKVRDDGLVYSDEPLDGYLRKIRDLMQRVDGGSDA